MGNPCCRKPLFASVPEGGLTGPISLASSLRPRQHRRIAARGVYHDDPSSREEFSWSCPSDRISNTRDQLAYLAASAKACRT